MTTFEEKLTAAITTTLAVGNTATLPELVRLLAECRGEHHAGGGPAASATTSEAQSKVASSLPQSIASVVRSAPAGGSISPAGGGSEEPAPTPTEPSDAEVEALAKELDSIRQSEWDKNDPFGRPDGEMLSTGQRHWAATKSVARFVLQQREERERGLRESLADAARVRDAALREALDSRDTIARLENSVEMLEKELAEAKRNLNDAGGMLRGAVAAAALSGTAPTNPVSLSPEAIEKEAVEVRARFLGEAYRDKPLAITAQAQAGCIAVAKDKLEREARLTRGLVAMQTELQRTVDGFRSQLSAAIEYGNNRSNEVTRLSLEMAPLQSKLSAALERVKELEGERDRIRRAFWGAEVRADEANRRAVDMLAKLEALREIR